jgi:RNA polymerase sigma-70 factor (ECF subfamily)
LLSDWHPFWWIVYLMVAMGEDSVCVNLLSKARRGDRDAEGQLLELFRAYLKILARLQIDRTLQGKADASDLVQETFLQARRSFAQFRGTTEGEVAVWLRKILASRLAMFARRYRTRQRDVLLEQQLDQALEHSSQALVFGIKAAQSSPSHHIAQREEAVLLSNALAELPPDYREVLILRHLEGKSFPEVARHMGRTLDSVKNLWARAVARMRRKLGDLE